MPLSIPGRELQAAQRLHYGDPCYQPAWGESEANCKSVSSNLATYVLSHYGIGLANAAPSNQWSSCCPLDLLNQDPFACIKMSLSAMMLDGQYWECYADEFGLARFVKVLEGSTEAGKPIDLRNVQYCVPSIQTQNLVDMVIVKAADPPAFRQCGPWFSIVDKSMVTSSTNLQDLSFLFTGPGTSAQPSTHSTGFGVGTQGRLNARGMKFTWGQINGYNSLSTDNTCDHFQFSQHGAIMYPDFRRKQGYKDGIVDIFEIGPFMNILYWLIDTDFSSFSSDNYIKDYSVQFTQSTEMPCYLDLELGGNYSSQFGPVCDLGSKGTGTSPTTYLNVGGSIVSLSCKSIGSSVTDARGNANTVTWDEFSLPAFYGYAKATSKINFLDISKWDVGSNICQNNQQDFMYQSTTSLMTNGCTLDRWASYNVTAPLYVDLGWQKDRKTFDIPHSSCYIELPCPSPEPDGLIRYALRAQAPNGSSLKITSQLSPTSDWTNPYWPFMLTYVNNRFTGQLPSAAGGAGVDPAWSNMATAAAFKYPGVLFGVDGESLFTGDLTGTYAKITINRPGIVVTGKGKDVSNFLDATTMRAMPVYIIDFPAPMAAKGGWKSALDSSLTGPLLGGGGGGSNWGTNNWFDGVVNPDTDVYDNMFCTVEPTDMGDTEKVTQAMIGNVLSVDFPFLYPNFTPGMDAPAMKSVFNRVGQLCYQVANNLYNYFAYYRDMPNRSLSYICGPPERQSDIPMLGQSVNTPYGIRTIQSISFQYADQSAYSMTVEVGPATWNQASAGRWNRKRMEDLDMKGRVVKHSYGSLFKVNVDGIGVINAWNSDPWPWQVGDIVTVHIYNHPQEL